MTTNLNKYVEQVKTGFQQNKGRGSVYCFPPISTAEVVVNIVKQFYTKSPGAQVFVVVDGYATRKAILERLDKEEDASFNIKILSVDYIKKTYQYNYRLLITVGVNDDFDIINFLSEQSKFMLSIITKNIMNTDYITKIRRILPEIEVTVSNVSVRNDNVYSPVEETRLGTDLSLEDRELYNKYTEYISTCVSIFGDLSNIDKCRYGDTKFNVSASEFREAIAKENGWNIELNTSIEWNKTIDDIYNPNVLYERANTFYNITKQRRDLVTDNVAKLDVIWNILLDNLDKKILIVSKRGDFASIITKYINESTTLKCRDYHDSIESTIAIDDKGIPILIKSGKDKGKPKVMGAQASSTLNMRLFNEGMINVLSIKNSSNVKLEIAVDVVIFTSPFVDDVIAFKTRFTNIEFNSVPTITYKVYCRGTIESKHLSNQKESSLITVIDDNDNFIGYDENNGDIIL